jgi:hypothetical protein
VDGSDVIFITQFIHGVAETLNVSLHDVSDYFRSLFLYLEEEFNGTVDHF